MRVLLDTNVVLWWSLDRGSLRSEVSDLLMSDATTRVLSAAVPWEVAIKWRLGKLPLPEHPRDWIARMSGELVVDALPITQAHGVAGADLPDHHRDPFDRVLIAQARAEGIPILTADRVFERYDVEVIPAR